jgi:hypothetical protein
MMCVPESSLTETLLTHAEGDAPPPPTVPTLCKIIMIASSSEGRARMCALLCAYDGFDFDRFVNQHFLFHLGPRRFKLFGRARRVVEKRPAGAFLQLRLRPLLHFGGACGLLLFLPLKVVAQDFYAPRGVRVAARLKAGDLLV